MQARDVNREYLHKALRPHPRIGRRHSEQKADRRHFVPFEKEIVHLSDGEGGEVASQPKTWKEREEEGK